MHSLVERTATIAKQARADAPARRSANRESDPQFSATTDDWRTMGELTWVGWPDGKTWGTKAQRGVQASPPQPKPGKKL